MSGFVVLASASPTRSVSISRFPHLVSASAKEELEVVRDHQFLTSRSRRQPPNLEGDEKEFTKHSICTLSGMYSHRHIQEFRIARDAGALHGVSYQFLYNQ